MSRSEETRMRGIVWLIPAQTGYYETHFRVVDDPDGVVPLGLGRNNGTRGRLGVLAREAQPWAKDALLEMAENGTFKCRFDAGMVQPAFPAKVVVPRLGRTRFAFVPLARTPEELAEKIESRVREMARAEEDRDAKIARVANDIWPRVCEVLGVTPENEDLGLSGKGSIYNAHPIVMDGEGELKKVDGLAVLIIGGREVDSADEIPDTEIRRLIRLLPAT